MTLLSVRRGSTLRGPRTSLVFTLIFVVGVASYRLEAARTDDDEEPRQPGAQLASPQAGVASATLPAGPAVHTASTVPLPSRVVSHPQRPIPVVMIPAAPGTVSRPAVIVEAKTMQANVEGRTLLVRAVATQSTSSGPHSQPVLVPPELLPRAATQQVAAPPKARQMVSRAASTINHAQHKGGATFMQGLMLVDNTITCTDGLLATGAGVACVRGWQMPVAEVGKQLGHTGASWHTAANVPDSSLQWLQVGARGAITHGHGNFAPIAHAVGPVAIGLGVASLGLTGFELYHTQQELQELYEEVDAVELKANRSEQWWDDVWSLRLPSLEELDLEDDTQLTVAMMEHKEESQRLAMASILPTAGGAIATGCVCAGLTAAAPVGIACGVAGGTILLYKEFLRDDPEYEETWSEWRRNRLQWFLAAGSALEISEKSIRKSSPPGTLVTNVEEAVEVAVNKTSQVLSDEDQEMFALLHEAGFAYGYAKSLRILTRKTFMLVEAHVKSKVNSHSQDSTQKAIGVKVQAIRFRGFAQAFAGGQGGEDLEDVTLTEEQMFEFVMRQNSHVFGKAFDIAIDAEAFEVIGGSSHEAEVRRHTFSEMLSHLSPSSKLAAATAAAKVGSGLQQLDEEGRIPLVEGVAVTYDHASNVVTMELTDVNNFIPTFKRSQELSVQFGKDLLVRKRKSIFAMHPTSA